MEVDDKDEKKPSPAQTSEEQKKMTSSLARERFLRFLLSSENKPCHVTMYEKTKVNGTFLATDVSFENILMKSLVTPIALHEYATVRRNDVIYMQFQPHI